MSRLDLPPGALVGRGRELGFLEGFFQEAAVSGGAVLLSGEPRVGKTALLNGLADSASAAGTTVLRVAGAEFEGEISFAGLNQLLFPLLDDLDELGADHRDALGLGAGPNRMGNLNEPSGRRCFLASPPGARPKRQWRRALRMISAPDARYCDNHPGSYHHETQTTHRLRP